MDRVGETPGTRGVLDDIAQACLRSYAQILFSRSLGVGGLLVLATLVVPRVGLTGMLAVLGAWGVATALGYDPSTVRSGLYGYNALLVGLGIGALLAPGPPMVFVLVAAVVASVALTAALHALLSVHLRLPVYTLPFLVVFPAVLGVIHGAGWTASAAPALVADVAPTWLAPLSALGALFFVPQAEAGLVVLAALVVHSRIATVLGALGLVVAQAAVVLVGSGASTDVAQTLGFNVALVCVGLGGVWFVPSTASFVVALAGAAVAALLTLGLAPLSARLGVPLLVLPFNVTMLVGLLAMRQRVRDGAPKAVDFLVGTPEQHLHHHHTRVARFGSDYLQRFRAPFHGVWTCTQGVDGPTTHQGPWAQAADFEVLGPDGLPYAGEGARVEDFHCYGMPVLAVADGTVVHVVDGVADNPVGAVDTVANWGNLVVVQHGPGVYSLLAHLQPGSMVVKAGQVVRRGEPLGRCGSSGRSPRPHLHLQLQATARPGDATIAFQLHDVVTVHADRQELVGTVVPAVGDRLRNLHVDTSVARRLDPVLGEPMTFSVSHGDHAVTETVVPELDLLGASWLRSQELGAALSYLARDGLFTVYDVLGSSASVLHLWRTALSRVPADHRDEVVWTDHLPLRGYLPAPVRWLLDPISPFLGPRGLTMRYRRTREGNLVVVQGRSDTTDRRGVPRVQTRATLGPEGVRQLSVSVGGTLRVAVREDVDARTPQGQSVRTREAS